MPYSCYSSSLRVIRGTGARRIDSGPNGRYSAPVTIPLTRYGLYEMIAATAICGALAAAGAVFVTPWLAAAPAALWLAVMAFFRDPPRRPDEPDAFLAPADGKVTDITPVGADGPLGADGVRIGVFMSVLDVHVNRCPFAAEVVDVAHHGGGHTDARRPEASERNESATILLTCRRGRDAYRVVVRQVAGLIARRIVTDLVPRQRLAAGERIGMVKFGSRVELMVPAGAVGQVAVSVGQTVRAGRTVLIRPPGREKRP